jgi:formate dehydrogenase major subunit
MTRRTGNSEIVVQDYLSLNPADAQRKSIRTGDRVRLSSARGEVELEARVTDEVKPGILYTTFHFPDAMVNNVTGQGCDADTMCPEYKVIAADVEFVSAGKPKKKRMMDMA